MKNKHGFTLIELLAVIVVLAIIALIATPIVIRTIENSKRGATIESVSNMVKTAELYFITSDPKYGKINLLDENLSYGGQKPELGEVEVNKDGYSRVYAYINGYCVTKEFNTELYASKTSKEECNWYGTDNYETKEGITFILNNQEVKNYLIYGNSIQEVRSGKNLFDYNNLPTSSWAQKQENGYFVSSGTNIRFYTYKTLENYIGQTVTISFDLTTSEDGKFSIYQYQNNGIGISFNKIDKQMTANTKQRISATGVVKKLGTVENYSEGEIIVYKDGYTGSFLVNNIQFELGSTATSYEEYGAMPSPEYPSEVKSTGDLITSDNCSSYGNDACDNIGKYIIQIKSVGKNLWNDANTNYREIYWQYENSIWETNNSSATYVYQNIYLDKGTYRLSTNLIEQDDDGLKLEIRNLNNNTLVSLRNSVVGRNQVSYTVAEPGFYKICVGGKANGLIKFTDIQLEKGEELTTYEPYQEKVTDIYLDEPLRKIGDYADYIDFENKRVVRNIYEMKIPETLTLSKNSDEWQREGYTSWYSKGLFESSKNSDEQLRNVLSNRFIGGKWQWSGAKEPYNYIGYNYRGIGYFIISNEYTSITSGDDTETQKSKIGEWFKNNETYLYFPLATPTEETIDAPNIEMLKGVSTLSINANISPSNVKLTTNK